MFSHGIQFLVSLYSEAKAAYLIMIGFTLVLVVLCSMKSFVATVTSNGLAAQKDRRQRRRNQMRRRNGKLNSEDNSDVTIPTEDLYKAAREFLDKRERERADALREASETVNVEADIDKFVANLKLTEEIAADLLDRLNPALIDYRKNITLLHELLEKREALSAENKEIKAQLEAEQKPKAESTDVKLLKKEIEVKREALSYLDNVLVPDLKAEKAMLLAEHARLKAQNAKLRNVIASLRSKLPNNNMF
uniref:RAB6-interacting golgin n=1 Tax=Panagrellus redivivus TaxID=6233 RepID=A0A7E4VDM0_PANRE